MLIQFRMPMLSVLMRLVKIRAKSKRLLFLFGYSSLVRIQNHGPDNVSGVLMIRFQVWEWLKEGHSFGEKANSYRVASHRITFGPQRDVQSQ